MSIYDIHEPMVHFTTVLKYIPHSFALVRGGVPAIIFNKRFQKHVVMMAFALAHSYIPFYTEPKTLETKLKVRKEPIHKIP